MVCRQALYKCRLCRSHKIQYYFTIRGYSLFRCSICNYFQIIDKPSEDEISEIYGDFYFTSQKYQDSTTLYWENQRRLKILTKILPYSNAKILDVGCATGDFLLTAKAKYQMYGCDISPFAVSIAQKKNPDISHNIFVTDMDLSSLKGTMKYDAICLWDVIEHLWDPYYVCDALVSILKPSGFLVISTPDIGSVTARLMRQRWAFMTPPEHMGFFNLKSSRYLFEVSLPLRFVYRKVAGKWTNMGFLVYKLRRIFPTLIPEPLANTLDSARVGRFPIYVPTHDIQYIVAQK